jgi:3-keto-5-aminohexanoate cleavage enzyme
MGEPVIIAAAVVGAEVTREQSPAVPYTPAEIAAASLAAERAGAAVVHLHARWPDGRPSQEAAHFSEIIERLRAAGSRLVVQCSTGGAVGMPLEQRLGALVPGAEMGTLNMGTLNFGDQVFVNSRPDIVRVAGRLREARPGAGVRGVRRRHARHPGLAARAGPPGPALPRVPVLGVPGGWLGRSATCASWWRPPEAVHWSVAGVGRAELPLAEVALAMGGHVRVGLEDNLFIEKGVLATGTDQLVAAAAALAARAGRPLATPAQARALLGLG